MIYDTKKYDTKSQRMSLQTAEQPRAAILPQRQRSLSGVTPPLSVVAWLLPLLLLLPALLSLAGCGAAADIGPSPANPVTVTVWHTYVENMRDTFDDLVREFNSTVGAEHGVTVKVTSVADASVINVQLIAAANKDPGAPALPDMAVIYPQIAVTLAEQETLADLSRYFSPAELDTFVPQFVDEGRLGTESLYLIPVAKSTEVLYVNRTLFDRFASAGGFSMDSLATFEGIAEVAGAYYAWTDASTPDIPDDGKMFFFPENLFNQAMIAYQQLGESIIGANETNGAGGAIGANELDLQNPVFRRIWDCYYGSAVRGGTAIYSGWSNYLAATGDIVCAIGTSAGASFYPESITYADNTKEPVVFDVLPYPVFEGGEPVALQRGGGFCVFRSETEQEYAACLFLKWFTEVGQNLYFCANTGYMPVRKVAFDRITAGDFPAIDNTMIEKSLLTVAEMQKTYRFYFPPVFDGFDNLQTRYADSLRLAAFSGRETYLRLLETRDGADAFSAVSEGALEHFVQQMRP